MKRTATLSLPLLAAALLGAWALPRLDRQQSTRFTVPEGFAVEQVATHEQVGPVVVLTFDAKGRMVVAKEFGDIVTLVPGPDGTFEQRVFTDRITNSQGIVFDGPDMLVTAVGPEGTALYRAVDENDDARADRIELVESVNRRIEDHGPHSPFWGPDGHLYWMHANTSGIYADEAPLSPVRSFDDASLLQRATNFYRLPAGKLFRKDAARHAGPVQGARTDWELVSVGMRNAYDAAFNSDGELFTYDSDHEPDLAMPWYRATRTLHLLPGGNYGYREGSGVHPEYYFDDAPGLENQERGSPTGVVAYQAYAYPAEYRDMLLFADWSRGRIIMSRLTKSGAGYTPSSRNFVFGTPLNVTDVDVGPDGNVYFSLGGRYTQGGIYRVVYRGTNAAAAPAATRPIDRVLTMIQPRSAPSRELARATKAQLGERGWQQQLTAVVRDARATPERRARALELLQVFGPAPDEALLTPLLADPSADVRAAGTYFLGLKSTDTARRALAGRLRDADPFVQRRAAEALIRSGVNPTIAAPLDPVADLFPLLSSPDRSLRYAARTLLREINPNLWREEALRLEAYPAAPEALLAYVQTIRAIDMFNFARFVNRELELLRANPAEPQLLDLVRLIQYTMTKDQGVRTFPVVPSASRVKGGVIYMPGRGFFNMDEVGAPTAEAAAQARPGGQQGNQPATAYAQIGALLLERFPAADWRVNREIARVLAYLQTPGALPEIVAEMDSPRSDVKQQIHYADMASRFESGWDDATVERMTLWFEKAARERVNATAMRTDFLAKLPEARRTATLARIQAAAPQVAALPGAGGGGGGGFGGGGGPMTAEQIESLIYNPQTAAGGLPSAGLAAYEKAACAACHTFGPVGVAVGPDLTTIGQRFNRADLVNSIAHPSAAVADQYEATTITRTDGTTVTGLVLQETAQAITLQGAGGAETTVPVAQLRSRARSEKSLMPEGLLDLLTGAERNHLLALLTAGPAAIPDTALARVRR